MKRVEKIVYIVSECMAKGKYIFLSGRKFDLKGTLMHTNPHAHVHIYKTAS